MEYFLAILALLSTVVAVCGSPSRDRGIRAATVKFLPFVIAAAVFIVTCVLIYKKNSNEENVRNLIRQGEVRAVSNFIAPISFFYSDHLEGVHMEKLDASKFFSPDILEAMQNICFSDGPKHVMSIPPRTWGDEFGNYIRAGVAEIKETLALYGPYMSSEELQVTQDIVRDSLVKFMLSNPDFSHEHDSPLVIGGLCGGITPIGQYENYLHKVLRLKDLIDHGGK